MAPANALKNAEQDLETGHREEIPLIYFLGDGGCCFVVVGRAANDHLRNSFLSPACIMATIVLVTEVPMLAPMMIGTADFTSSTEGV